MLSVTVVEDDKKDAEIVESYLNRYSKEKGISMQIYAFHDSIDFLTDYKPIYDLIFMDIGMPYINGMDAAKKLRELDSEVPLVFETSLKQYAPKGYDVSATGFLVKPITYYSFFTLLDKIIRNINREKNQDIAVHTADGVKIIPLSHIHYVEVMGHKIIYKTDAGEVETSGTLKSIEEKLPVESFSRCNSCYLVHLKYVQAIHGNTVIVGGEELAISRSKKKEFTASVLSYFGDKI